MKTTSLVILAALTAPAAANAIAYQSFDPDAPPTFPDDIESSYKFLPSSNDIRFGFSFEAQATGGILEVAAFVGRRIGPDVAFPVTFELYDDDGSGLPDTLLSSWTQDVLYAFNGQFLRIADDGSIQVTQGETYHFVWNHTDAIGAEWWVPLGSGDLPQVSTEDGVNWVRTTEPGYTHVPGFSIVVTPAPPTAVGVLGLLALRARRRRA